MRKRYAGVTLGIAMAAAMGIGAYAAGSITGAGTITDVVVEVADESQTEIGVTTTPTAQNTESVTVTGADGKTTTVYVPGEVKKQGPGAIMAYANQYKYTITTNMAGSEVSDAVKSVVEQVNKGQVSIGAVANNAAAAGYEALAPVQRIAKTNTELNTEVKAGADEKVTVTMTVPNLVEGLNVQVLVYNEETGVWELVAPNSVDFAKKEVNVTLKAGALMCVVYR